MNVNKISLNTGNKTNFCANEKSTPKKEFWTEMEKQGIKKPSPVVLGLAEGIGWFGIGMLADKMLNKCFKKMQTPKKFSLITNGILGVVMGTYTYMSESKKIKK